MDKKKIGAILAIVGGLFIATATFSKGIVTAEGGKGKFKMEMGVGFLGAKVCFVGVCKGIGMGKTFKKGSQKGSAYGGLLFGLLGFLAAVGAGVITFINKDGSKDGIASKLSLATLISAAAFLLFTIIFLITVKSDSKGGSLGWGLYVAILGAGMAIASFFMKDKAEA